MLLYKYRNNSELTEKIFTNKNIWLSNIKNLNDPFEGAIKEISPNLKIQWTEACIKGYVIAFKLLAEKSILEKKVFWNLSPTQTEIILQFIFGNNYSQKEIYEIICELKKQMTGSYAPIYTRTPFDTLENKINNVGIFSVSSVWDNQLLWSHYADSTKGIAIGFSSENNSKLGNEEYCLKVNYSNTLPEFFIEGRSLYAEFQIDENYRPYLDSQISFKDETFKKAISTKNVCWSYENEWRYVEETFGAYPWPGKIEEIIFGLLCPEAERLKYIKLANKYVDNIMTFYEIIKIENTNSITRVQVDNF